MLVALSAQESEVRKLPHFTNLVVNDRIIVRLIKSESDSVIIKPQGIQTSSIQTEVNNSLLNIRTYGEPFAKKKVIVTLYYTQIKSITVNGGADVSTVSAFKSDSLKVDLNTGGMLYLNADLGCLSGKITEGSILTAEGKTREMDFTVATSGSLSAFNLISEIGRIIVSSGGKAKVNVVKELEASASSRGYISYKGSPAKFTPEINTNGTISVYEP
jgi:hypothetical protein